MEEVQQCGRLHALQRRRRSRRRARDKRFRARGVCGRCVCGRCVCGCALGGGLRDVRGFCVGEKLRRARQLLRRCTGHRLQRGQRGSGVRVDCRRQGCLQYPGFGSALPFWLRGLSLRCGSCSDPGKFSQLAHSLAGGAAVYVDLEALAVLLETADLLVVITGLVQLGLGDLCLEGIRILLERRAHRRGSLHLVRRVVMAVFQGSCAPASIEGSIYFRYILRLAETVSDECSPESPNVLAR